MTWVTTDTSSRKMLISSLTEFSSTSSSDIELLSISRVQIRNCVPQTTNSILKARDDESLFLASVASLLNLTLLLGWFGYYTLIYFNSSSVMPGFSSKVLFRSSRFSFSFISFSYFIIHASTYSWRMRLTKAREYRFSPSSMLVPSYTEPSPSPSLTSLYANFSLALTGCSLFYCLC